MMVSSTLSAEQSRLRDGLGITQVITSKQTCHRLPAGGMLPRLGSWRGWDGAGLGAPLTAGVPEPPSVGHRISRRACRSAGSRRRDASSAPGVSGTTFGTTPPRHPPFPPTTGLCSATAAKGGKAAAGNSGRPGPPAPPGGGAGGGGPGPPSLSLARPPSGLPGGAAVVAPLLQALAGPKGSSRAFRRKGVTTR